MGIDQKKQRVIVAAMLRSLPVICAFPGKPTFLQKTSLGEGAASMFIVFTAWPMQRMVRIDHFGVVVRIDHFGVVVSIDHFEK
jgi:hypothetical protein